MCRDCDYQAMLEQKGVEPTALRRLVLEAVGAAGSRPVTAAEVLEGLLSHQGVNRVTVYRILELLVQKGIVERISSGDRSFRYGLAPNERHQPHPHFYCLSCGRMECLEPLASDQLNGLEHSAAGRVRHIQVRLDGTCDQCLKDAKD
jgi:Fur family ferric uptake transcriptional regulator